MRISEKYAAFLLWDDSLVHFCTRNVCYTPCAHLSFPLAITSHSSFCVLQRNTRGLYCMCDTRHQDMEPEYIAVGNYSNNAFVTLQARRGSKISAALELYLEGSGACSAREATKLISRFCTKSVLILFILPPKWSEAPNLSSIPHTENLILSTVVLRLINQMNSSHGLPTG